MQVSEQRLLAEEQASPAVAQDYPVELTSSLTIAQAMQVLADEDAESALVREDGRKS